MASVAQSEADAAFERSRLASWQAATSVQTVGDFVPTAKATGPAADKVVKTLSADVPDSIRLAVPRGWTFLARLFEPYAVLVYRPLHPRQVDRVACGGNMCKRKGTLRVAEILKGLGAELMQKRGFYCSTACAMPVSTYRDNRPDSSLYPLAATRFVRANGVGFGEPRHWGGKSSRRSNIVARHLD